jgi:hypothetical protein
MTLLSQKQDTPTKFSSTLSLAGNMIPKDPPPLELPLGRLHVVQLTVA